MELEALSARAYAASASRKKFHNHPPKQTCTTFEEVLAIEKVQCEIVASLIGCRCAFTMTDQQQEAMKQRQEFFRTPREWIEASKRNAIPQKLEERIKQITEWYALTRRCHRN